jgi:hypothetical protein
LDKKFIEEKLNLLGSIQAAAVNVREGEFSQHTQVVLAAMIVSGIVSVPLQSLVWSLIICTLAFFLAFKMCKLPKSWGEAMDNRLTDYEPVDFLAYAKLQEQTKECGELGFSAVLKWAAHEEMVIRANIPKPTDGVGQRFMRKELPQVR